MSDSESQEERRRHTSSSEDSEVLSTVSGSDGSESASDTESKSSSGSSTSSKNESDKKNEEGVELEETGAKGATTTEAKNKEVAIEVAETEHHHREGAYHPPEPNEGEKKGMREFAWVTLVVQAILLVLYCCVGTYGPSVQPDAAAGNMDGLTKYPFLADVHMMVFVGFGFLMMFLKRYSNSSLGLNFFVSAVCVQWAILVNSFFHQLEASIADDAQWHKVRVDVPQLIEGDFGAAAVMITFGAVLGKTSPLQMLVVGLLEVFFYALNKMLIELVYSVVDLGGSMVIHAFGAYFGLALALVIGEPAHREHRLCGANRMSDLFAMIGTIFLWMLWPSFNSVLAPAGPVQHRAIVNTLLALCAACMVSFACSTLFRKEHRFSMVDVQNATLAGGVAMGSSTSMAVYPGGALGIGCLAGLLSCVGYNYVQPALERRLRLHDTCGVHNLHGMPGVLGALVSAVVAGVGATADVYGSQLADNFPAGYSAGKQAGIQVASIVNTLVVAIVGGSLTGLIIRPLKYTVRHHYDDAINWIEELDEEDE